MERHPALTLCFAQWELDKKGDVYIPTINLKVFSFFHISECALAAFETTSAVSAFMIRQAKRANTITAFVANIPSVCLGVLFPATLTRNPRHNIEF